MCRREPIDESTRVPPQAQPGVGPPEYASGDFPPRQGVSGGVMALFLCLVALILIVIGGGIVAATVPRFGSNPNEARQAATKQEISTLAGAIELFRADTGRYPTTQEGLAALWVQPAANGQSWHGPYLAHGMWRDPWSNHYIYRYPGKHNSQSFDVFSTGPDGREGGGDDIGNW